MLPGYRVRGAVDADFQRGLREKCVACLAAAARLGAGQAVLANLELGIERLAAYGAAPRDAKTRSLRNSIRLLSVVASLHAPPLPWKATPAGFRTTTSPRATCSRCSSTRPTWHARTSSRTFLPHLLHLKVWFTKEAELVAYWDVDDRSRRMKSLQRLYNDHMNSGTAQFAMYYKEWLKCGADAPPVPSVPLPSMPGDFDTWEKQHWSRKMSKMLSWLMRLNWLWRRILN